MVITKVFNPPYPVREKIKGQVYQLITDDLQVVYTGTDKLDKYLTKQAYKRAWVHN
jgi:hypothetical protein